MYSNNDFRSYSENHLEHASAYGNFKFPGGKNTSEYNHAYYLRNKFRWGVDENNVGGVGSQAISTDGSGSSKRNLKERINDFIDNSDTKLDDRARELYRNTRDAVKNAPRNAKNAINRRIDNSSTLADNYARSAVRSLKNGNVDAARSSARSAAKTAVNDIKESAKQLQSDVRYQTTTAKRNARVNTDLAVRNAKRAVNSAANAAKDEAYRFTNTGLRNKFKSNEANTYSEGAKRRQSNVGGVGAQGISTDGSGSSKRNLKERVNQFIDNSNTKLDDRARDIYRNTRDAVKNTPGNIRDAVNRRIDESDTLADNYARSAVRSLRSGNRDAARTSARSALNEVGRDINRRIDESETLADDYARSAARSLREGNVRQAGRSAGRAARAAAYDVREGARNLADNWKNRNNVTLGEDREDNRDINPQTGRPNRPAATNTNTARDNGTLVPIQKNRRQEEPERQRDSLAGRNDRSTDTGTGSNAARRAESNWNEAIRQENRIHRAQNGYFNSDFRETSGRMDKEQAERMGDNEHGKEFLGIDGRRPDEQISRGQRGKDFQNRRYLDASEQHGKAVTEMFKNIAEADGRVSSSAATKAVNAASSAINDYRRAVEAYGSGSDEAQEAYWEAISAIMGELDRKD